MIEIIDMVVHLRMVQEIENMAQDIHNEIKVNLSSHLYSDRICEILYSSLCNI